MKIYSWKRRNRKKRKKKNEKWLCSYINNKEYMKLKALDRNWETRLALEVWYFSLFGSSLKYWIDYIDYEIRLNEWDIVYRDWVKKYNLK